MNARQKSIQILQDAVKNKTLGAYKGAKDCRYYDKVTDSCCAVGTLIPREELMQYVDDSGNVSVIGGFEEISHILNGNVLNNNTGLTKEELTQLQIHHDDIISLGQNPMHFESYVASLV